MTKKQVKHKLNIFQVLEHISRKDIGYYKNLTDEEQKALMPLVVARWLSGTSSARQVYFINELVNPHLFTLHQHKELLYYLMTICAPGQKQRYFWNKTVSNKSTSTPITLSVVRQYFKYSTREALDVLPLLSNDDILQYADDLGRQTDELKQLKKELKSRA